MHPYRVQSLDDATVDPELHRDDRILAGLMIFVGGIRVALAIALGETFGTEATVAAVVAAIGLALLVASYRPHRA